MPRRMQTTRLRVNNLRRRRRRRRRRRVIKPAPSDPLTGDPVSLSACEATLGHGHPRFAFVYTCAAETRSTVRAVEAKRVARKQQAAGKIR